MGFIALGYSYNQRSAKEINGLDGLVKIVDDVIIAPETHLHHFSYIEEFMKRCIEHHIT